MKNLNVIELKNIHKYFNLSNDPKSFLLDLFNLKTNKFHALKNISFSIKKGEIVGIIGANGAGKSSLLKIIAGTIKPNKGKVKLRGKVLSILELGIGFDPNLSGLDNLYLGAIYMGYSRKDVNSILDKIIEFSELEDFINYQLKTYSSGMYSRLAFSLIIHLNADVLIMDEALSTGDIYFQKKCISRIKYLVSNGMTILFVSHSITQISELCKRTIYLENGKLINDGDTRISIYKYEQNIKKSHINNSIPTTLLSKNDQYEEFSKTIKCYIKYFYIVDHKNKKVSKLEIGNNYFIIFDINFNEHLSFFSLSFKITNTNGINISTFTNKIKNSSSKKRKIFKIKFKNNLLDGDYYLGGGIAEYYGNDYKVIHIVRDLDFSVKSENCDSSGYTNLEAKLINK